MDSLQSFHGFRTAAYDHLATVPLGQRTTQEDVYALYGCYRDYNPLRLPPKQPLTGRRLYRHMGSLVESVGDRLVLVQSADGGLLDKEAALEQYRAKAQDLDSPLDDLEDSATRNYLHVYPSGTTISDDDGIQYAEGRRTDNNWRIGINVKPEFMAEAVDWLVDIPDGYNEISKMKFLAPGAAGKADSVIVYLRHTDDYPAIRQTFQDAVAAQEVQGRFAPMWQEFEPGFAEAAEPPHGGGSFGRYRSVLTFLAWELANQMEPDGPTRETFYQALEETFSRFGVPVYAPHRQADVGNADDWGQLQELFFDIRRAVEPDRDLPQTLTNR